MFLKGQINCDVHSLDQLLSGRICIETRRADPHTNGSPPPSDSFGNQRISLIAIVGLNSKAPCRFQNFDDLPIVCLSEICDMYSRLLRVKGRTHGVSPAGLALARGREWRLQHKYCHNRIL